MNNILREHLKIFTICKENHQHIVFIFGTRMVLCQSCVSSIGALLNMQLCSVSAFVLLIITVFIVVVQTQMPDPKTYRQHFENKHPKNPLPEELKSVAV